MLINTIINKLFFQNNQRTLIWSTKASSKTSENSEINLKKKTREYQCHQENRKDIL